MGIVDPNVVILAGGVSSRMKRALRGASQLAASLRFEAEHKPKSMIGFGQDSRPFLDYLLNNIGKAGYRSVVIVVGERDDSIRGYYERSGNARRFPTLEISYAVQPISPGREKPLGTADALMRALQAKPEWKGKRLTVCNSDNLYSTGALELLLRDTHENAMIDYDRSALRFDEARIAGFSVIQKNTDGFLRDIIEKPAADEIALAADAGGRIGVSMNLWRFSYDSILPCLEAVPLDPVRGEKELPAAVKMMIGLHPRSVFAIPRSEHVPDLTSPEDIVRVREELDQ